MPSRDGLRGHGRTVVCYMCTVHTGLLIIVGSGKLHHLWRRHLQRIIERDHVHYVPSRDGLRSLGRTVTCHMCTVRTRLLLINRWFSELLHLRCRDFQHRLRRNCVHTALRFRHCSFLWRRNLKRPEHLHQHSSWQVA